MENDISKALEDTINTLAKHLATFSERQLNQVPFAGSWTAGQVFDHLLKSYDVVNLLQENTARTERPVDAHIGEIKAVFLDFDTKLQSPEFIIPSNGPFSKDLLTKRLVAKQQNILHFARSNDLTATCLNFEFPGQGLLTKLEWAHFILYHTQRHMHQLNNISHLIHN